VRCSGALSIKPLEHIDLTQWRVLAADSSKKVNRTDHSFTWEDRIPLRVGANSEDAEFARVNIQVIGAEVSGFRTFVKIPEDWKRRRERNTLAGQLLAVWKWGLISLLGVFAALLFFKNFKMASAVAPWRKLSRWAAVPTAAFIVMRITNCSQSRGWLSHRNSV
jgi:hypothetical protein